MSLHFNPMPGSSDNALAVNNKGAPDDTFAHFLFFDDTVFFTDSPVGITQQREGEVQFFLEFYVGGDTVAAHTEDVCFSGCEGGDFITEIAGFLRSTGCVVFWVKIEDDRLAFEIFERHYFLLVGFEAESRRFFPSF